MSLLGPIAEKIAEAELCMRMMRELFGENWMNHEGGEFGGEAARVCAAILSGEPQIQELESFIRHCRTIGKREYRQRSQFVG